MNKIQAALVLGIFLLPALSYPSDQKAVDVANVNAAIRAAHASWTAKETWLSELSESQLKRIMGVQRAPEGDLDFESIPGYRSRELPAVVDWRNKDGVNWLGPVLNQGNCGSCVAFAAVAALEAQSAISAGIPWLRRSYSPQALFSCGGGGCDFGWMSREAAEYLVSDGIPDQACMPYTSGSSAEDVACRQICSDAKQRMYKIAAYREPTHFGSGIEPVKEALLRGPLVTSMRVYADFVTYSGGIYKHVSGAAIGGHAISMVGYDEQKRAWLIRNSWGTEWGEGGFAWVSWDDRSGVGVDTIQFELAGEKSVLTVTAPFDREYISEEYLVSMRMQGVRSEMIQFRINGRDGKTLKTISCKRTGDVCSASLDTTSLQDGRYEILAEVTGEGEALRSQPREFFVINSEPNLKISVLPASGVDLTKPLKGRPEFIIQTGQTGASSVPMQRLEFIVLDSSNQRVSTKSNDEVLERVKMGWRTSNQPNGTYRIYFRGETKYRGKVYAVETPRVEVTVKN